MKTTLMQDINYYVNSINDLNNTENKNWEYSTYQNVQGIQLVKQKKENHSVVDVSDFMTKQQMKTMLKAMLNVLVEMKNNQ